MMKKITFFIGSMGRGGAERVISILANHYAQQGWHVEIVMLLKNSVEYELSREIVLVDLSGSITSYVQNAVSWLTQIRYYLKKNRPDRVVSFVARINALVLTAALGLNLRIVVSERNDPRNDGRSAAMQQYCNLIYRTAERIVFQTEYERKCFCKAVQRKGMVIPNPVNVQAKKAQGSGNLRIVTAGRLAPQKNHRMLVDSCALLKEGTRDFSCDIFGEGPCRKELSDYIHQRGMDGCVHLRGSVHDLHRQMASADIFVMTSDYEGLSNALIEAMMMGFACITTAYPGAEELIVHGENGLVVPCRNAQALAEAIAVLAEHPELAARYSENARQTAELFRAEHVLQKWEQAVQE